MNKKKRPRQIHSVRDYQRLAQFWRDGRTTGQIARKMKLTTGQVAGMISYARSSERFGPMPHRDQYRPWPVAVIPHWLDPNRGGAK